MKSGLIIGVVVLVVLVAGFFLFGQSDDVPEVEVSESKTIEISIMDYSFNLGELTINVGDTVIWTNKDSVKHTVTSDSGDELGSELLLKDKSYSHTFNSKGELESLIKNILPTYMVIGSDWKDKEVIGQDYTQELRFFDRIKDYSTTDVLKGVK